MEESYIRILKHYNEIVAERKFILGDRPSSADMSFFGQYSQLVGLDPTPSKLAIENAPRMKPWCDVMDDLSGISVTDNCWISRANIEASKPLQNILREISVLYLPFLRANAKALGNGEKDFSVELQGILWKQNTFPYP